MSKAQTLIVLFLIMFGLQACEKDIMDDFSSNIASGNRGIKVTGAEPDKWKITELYKSSYALVIGNGNYINGWDPLPGAIEDVREVANVLANYGFNVTFKTNLTKEIFLQVLSEFSIKYGQDRDNQLLVYYAGHGFTQKMANDEDLGYIVMVDTPLSEEDPVGFSSNAIDMYAIVTQAKMIQAKHVLFMFDSCFSGTLLSMRGGGAPHHISDSIQYPVRQFITAGRANEVAPDHSVFKQAFLDLLEGRDKEPIPDGYITGEELGLYLKTKVSQYNPAQNPQYGKIRDPKLDKGDFVFIPGKRDRSIDERNKKETEDHNTPMVMLSNTDTGEKLTPQNDSGKAILFSDPTISSEDDTKILQVTLMEEKPDELVFQVEYCMSKNLEGHINISITPDTSGWRATSGLALPGRRTIRFSTGLHDRAPAMEESSKLFINMDWFKAYNTYVGPIYRKIVPFKKTWIKDPSSL